MRSMCQQANARKEEATYRGAIFFREMFFSVLDEKVCGSRSTFLHLDRLRCRHLVIDITIRCERTVNEHVTAATKTHLETLRNQSTSSCGRYIPLAFVSVFKGSPIYSTRQQNKAGALWKVPTHDAIGNPHNGNNIEDVAHNVEVPRLGSDMLNGMCRNERLSDDTQLARVPVHGIIVEKDSLNLHGASHPLHQKLHEAIKQVVHSQRIHPGARYAASSPPFPQGWHIHSPHDH